MRPQALGIVLVLLFATLIARAASTVQTGFESGPGDWSAEGGVWEFGAPNTNYAPSPRSGSQLAGTLLRNYYPPNADARLVSPAFLVPAATGYPRLKYASWYDFNDSGDYGQLQVRPVGGDWQDVPGERLHNQGGSWSQRILDLSPFAGQTIQVAFRIVSNSSGSDAGWFIDDVSLDTGPMALASADGFESGPGDWSAEGGVWEFGAPNTNYAPSPRSGSQLAGTLLRNYYPPNADARLVSPAFLVPAVDQFPRLKYASWYDFGSGDHGQLQVRIDGADWQDVPGERLQNQGGSWSQRILDLRPYAGQTIQVGFRIVTNSSGSDAGWFIDDVSLDTGPMALASADGFESGPGDWSAEGGVWEFGAPNTNYAPSPRSGSQLAGTLLRNYYPPNADARLVSPAFLVPAVDSDGAVFLRYWHWSSLGSGDQGRLEISLWNGSAWEPWIPLDTPALATRSTAWTQASVNLHAFGGKQARLAFRFTSNASGTDFGWFIDDVSLSAYTPATLGFGSDSAVTHTFAANDERVYFVLDIPGGSHLRLTLEDLDDLGANEIYLRRSALPTVGAYDHRFSTRDGADQEIFAPDLSAGQWYVLLIGASVPGDESTVRLQATLTSGPLLQAVAPSRIGNLAPTPLTVTGAGFDGSASVTLRLGADIVATGATSAVSSTRLLVDLPTAGLIPGVYTLVVQQGAHSASLPLEVVADGFSRLETELIIPGKVGRHAPATIFVEYANVGNVAMPAPLLVVKGSDRALMTLDPALGARGLWTATQPAGFSDTLQILGSGETAGVLRPGERVRIPVLYVGIQQPWNFGDTAVQFDLGVFDSTNDAPVAWDQLKDSMRPDDMPADAWDAIWANFVAGVGPTWGDYAAMLADNAIHLARLGLKVSDVAELLAFELAQADGLGPVSTLASATDAAARQPGLGLAFSRSFPARLSQRQRTGPLGLGWTHNWEFKLEQNSAGDVTLHGPGGSRRRFQPDVRGGYFNQTGDHGTLTPLAGGTFELREKTGLVWAYRADGLLDHVRDLNGNRITATHADGRLTRLTHSASAQSLALAYAGDRLDTLTDPYGRVTRFTYDASGRLAAATAYGTSTTTYTYENGPGVTRRHALVSVAYPGGNHDHFTYDDRGRLASTANNGGTHAVRFGYDSAGTVTVTDATDAASRLFFDHRGQLARTQDPLGHTVSLAYDAAYNLTRVTAPSGSVELSYDARSNTTRTVNPLGHAIGMSYTDDSRLAALTDARGNTTGFDYDAKGNATALVYPNLTRETYGYDARGDIVTITNRRSQVTTLARDSTGRVTRKATHEGRTFDYTYDARGNLARIVDSELGTNTLVFNDRDQLASITYHDGKGFTFGYDAAGRRTRRTSHDDYTLNYHYDPAGRLHRLTDGENREIIEYLYDTTGRLSRENKGNGTWTTYAYDAAGQVLHMINYGPAGEIASRFDYTYDANGNRSSMTTLEGITTYGYDPLGQLTSVTYPDARHVTYEYDPAGNRITVNDNGTITPYITNSLNQYTSAGDTTYTFDADGNQIDQTEPSTSTIYIFDSENRITRIAPATGGTSEYKYDAFGNRAIVTHEGQTTRNLHDPIGLIDLVAEYNPSGAVQSRFDHGLGLVSKRTALPAQAHFYNFDAMGNTRELSGPTGAVANSYNYDAFGHASDSQETTTNPFKFTGRFGVVGDARGLTFMRARYYSPNVGRFVSKDPIGLGGGDINLYRYVKNNPIIFVDPLGLLEFQVANTNWCGPGQVNGKLGVWKESDPNANFPKMNHPDFAMPINDEDWACYYHDVALNDASKITDNEWDRFIKGWHADMELSARLLTESHNSLSSGNLLTGSRQALEVVLFGHPLLAPHGPAIVAVGKFIGATSSLFQSVGNFIGKIAAAFDPNEIIGPAGYGTANYLTGAGVFAYRVNFENYKTATAPAQVVVIENPLPEGLDAATFEFTSTGFGDQIFPVPAGARRYETTTKMTFGGVTFDVNIRLRFDPATRTAHARFESLDPASGLPPPVEVGFLPPENGTGRGMGHFAYVIAPRAAALITQTEIRNIGFVTFDPLAGGATFRTDLSVLTDPTSAPDPNRQALVTIDTTPPASAVSPLPPTSATPAFTVTWSGSDTGAGVAGYDIYAKTDDGPWTLALANTPATSTLWQGDYGRTHAFYSIARDGAGNLETAPATPPDAQTTVVAAPPRAAQTITFEPLPARRFGDPALTLAATASSGLPVGFTLVSGPATLAGAILTPTGVGSVVLRATQPGDNAYLPATAVERTLTVAKALQTIAFPALADRFANAPSFVLAATATSGLPVSYSLSGPATLSGATVTLTGATGTVSITATQAGDANHEPAPGLTRSFGVTAIPLLAQTITFDPVIERVFGEAPLTLVATSSSGLPVGFTLVDGPANLVGANLTFTEAGSVVVRASQAGNATYAAAPAVERTFTVARAPQTIEFAALADRVYSSAPLPLAATASSGLSVSFAVSGPAELAPTDPAALRLTGVGPITVTASQAGDSRYLPAPSIQHTFSVAKAPQTLVFPELPDRYIGEPAFVPPATTTSGLPILYTVVSGPATLDGSTITLGATAGLVTLRASQPGDANHEAATPIERTFTLRLVPKAALTLGNLVQTYNGSPRPITVTGGPASVPPLVTYNGSTTVPTNAGRYKLVARVGPNQKTGVLVINKARLVVNFTNHTRLVGSANPIFAPAYVGFFADDSAADLDKPPLGATKATPASPAGVYPISPKGGLDNNYVFAAGASQLTVLGFGGGYEALLVDGASTPVGKLTLAVPANSLAYTATLNLAGESKTVAVSSTSRTPGTSALVAAEGFAQAAATWNRPATVALPALTLALTVGADGSLAGTLTRDGQPFAVLAGGRLLYAPPAQTPVPWAGQHTVALHSAFVIFPENEGPFPRGSGVATAVVSPANGTLALAGFLADGAKLTATLKPWITRTTGGALDQVGYVAWINPYAARPESFLAGNLALQPQPETDRFPAGRRHIPSDAGLLTWKKAGGAKDRSYRAGFGPLSVSVAIDPWLPPTAAKPARGATPAVEAVTLPRRLGLVANNTATAALVLSHGPDDLDLGAAQSGLPGAATLTASFAPTATTLLTLAPVTTPPNPTGWKLHTFAPATGAFTGSFLIKDPAPAKPRAVSFTGTLRQAPADEEGALIGTGFFLVPGAVPSAEQPSGELRFSAP